MRAFVLSTVAFFVVRHYVNRYLDDLGVAKTFTRSTVAFCAALLVSYGIAYFVDWIAP